jgi:hypothetical protein
MMKTRFGIRSALLALAASVGLVACGGGGDGGVAPAPASGTLRVALTDAPSCGFDEVNVTVDRVRVHQSSAASEGDSGWYDIPVVNGPRKVDLLTLTNGVLLELGQTTLPAGKYEQLRLVLVSNKSTPMANTVKPISGVLTEMDTPSASQSGLKLINGFTVAPNTMTDIVLDFDACKSVVKRGNGSYGLKPVITMIPRTLTAIVGYVAMGLTDITVTAQNGGVVVKATQPNPTTGQFVLGPLNQNTYDVVITGKDRTTAVIAAVGVQLDQVTTLNSSAQPISMPLSPSGLVRGKVLPLLAAATEGAEVRALQPVGTVPLVEIAYTMTFDATTGAYELSLPVAAPRLATWSTTMINPVPLVPQDGNAAKYKLQALASGYNSSALKDVTVSATVPQTDQDFTLTLKTP